MRAEFRSVAGVLPGPPGRMRSHTERRTAS